MRAFPNLVMGPTHKWDDEPSSKHPEMKGKMHKKPACRWRGLTNTDSAALNVQARRGNHNVFAVTGDISGVFVVDVDVKDNGINAWDELLQAHETPTRDEQGTWSPSNHVVHTPSGGLHMYFKYEPRLEHIPNKAKFKLNGKKVGIDVRTNGGIIVMPPTVGSKGKSYEIVKCEDDAATVPEWLCQFLSQGATKKRLRKNQSESPATKKAKQQSPPQCDADDCLANTVRRLLPMIAFNHHSEQEWFDAGRLFAALQYKSLFFEGSRRFPGFDEVECEAKWQNCLQYTSALEECPTSCLAMLHTMARQDSPVEYYNEFMGIKKLERSIDFYQPIARIKAKHNGKHLNQKELAMTREAYVQHWRDSCAVSFASDGSCVCWVRKIEPFSGAPVLEAVAQEKLESFLQRRSWAYYDDNNAKHNFDLTHFFNANNDEFTYSNYKFIPYSPKHSLETHGGALNVFNTFMGFRAQVGYHERMANNYNDVPLDENHPQIRPLCEFIYNTVCGVDDIVEGEGGWSTERIHGHKQECYEYFMDWSAQGVQQPATNNQSLMVWRSTAKGTGKTIYWTFWCTNVVGNDFCEEITDKDHLEDRWSDTKPGLIYKVIDDVAEVKNLSFNGSTTSQFARRNKKYAHPETVLNTIRVVILSNEEEPISKDANERKTAYYDVSSTRHVNTDEGSAYLTQLRKDTLGIGNDVTPVQKANGLRTAQVFYDWLMQRDVSKFNLDNVPQTELAKKVKKKLECPLLRYLREYCHSDQAAGEMPPKGQGTPIDLMFTQYRQLNLGWEQQLKDERKKGETLPVKFIQDKTDFTKDIRAMLKRGGASDSDVKTATISYVGQKPTAFRYLSLNKMCSIIRVLTRAKTEHIPCCTCVDKRSTLRREAEATVRDIVLDAVIEVFQALY